MPRSSSTTRMALTSQGVITAARGAPRVRETPYTSTSGARRHSHCCSLPRPGPRYGRSTFGEIDVPSEFDDYEIGRELGQGVMGKVYLAEDAMLARPVAIKFIAQLDAATRQRFLLEARAIAQIPPPNVVAIYRVGTLDNRPSLVPELVRGESLARAGKPMAWQAVLDIAIGLAHGLAAAHRRNVVHCDL